MKIQLGDKITLIKSGVTSTVVKIDEKRRVTVDYEGKDNHILESTLIAHIEEGMFKLN